MLIASRVFFEVDTGERNAVDRTAFHQWICKLANLVALGNVRVEIVLTVEFGEISQRATDRHTDAKHMFDCFFVDGRQGARMAHTNGTDVLVRPLFVGIVLRVAEHLRLRLELDVNLEADGWFVVRHGGIIHELPATCFQFPV